MSPVTFGMKIMTFHKANIAAAVRHGGGSVDGLGCSVITDETINSALYQKILKENVHTSDYVLKLKSTQAAAQ